MQIAETPYDMTLFIILLKKILQNILVYVADKGRPSIVQAHGFRQLINLKRHLLYRRGIMCVYIHDIIHTSTCFHF